MNNKLYLVKYLQDQLPSEILIQGIDLAATDIMSMDVIWHFIEIKFLHGNLLFSVIEKIPGPYSRDLIKIYTKSNDLNAIFYTIQHLINKYPDEPEVKVKQKLFEYATNWAIEYNNVNLFLRLSLHFYPFAFENKGTDFYPGHDKDIDFINIRIQEFKINNPKQLIQEFVNSALNTEINNSDAHTLFPLNTYFKNWNSSHPAIF